MNKRTLFFIAFSLFLIIGCGSPTQDLTDFVTCMKENDVVMYGSATCSYCTQQKKTLGDASALLEEIECNPHQKNAQSERCLENNIRLTPTWVIEREGQEVARLEGLQQLESLATFSGCTLS